MKGLVVTFLVVVPSLIVGTIVVTGAILTMLLNWAI